MYRMEHALEQSRSPLATDHTRPRGYVAVLYRTLRLECLGAKPARLSHSADGIEQRHRWRHMARAAKRVGDRPALRRGRRYRRHARAPSGTWGPRPDAETNAARRRCHGTGARSCRTPLRADDAIPEVGSVCECTVACTPMIYSEWLDVANRCCRFGLARPLLW